MIIITITVLVISVTIRQIIANIDLAVVDQDRKRHLLLAREAYNNKANNIEIYKLIMRGPVNRGPLKIHTSI